jgi:hypothetical protein
MRLRQNRRTERAGVNEARALFEACDCVFQEVDLGNDYGKDAYVDLVDEQEVTGHCVALQIKSGPSFRTAKGYAIPVEGHADVWRSSSVPIAGIVFDPETKDLYLCDITSYLSEHAKDRPTKIPVSRDNVLTKETLEKEFKPLFRELARKRAVGGAILQLCSEDEDLQIDALSDCFANGRSDARVFILLRYLLPMLEGEPLRVALTILSHATPHPDIMWRPSNWVPEKMRGAMRPHFRWSLDEIERLLTEIDWEEWQRGDVGQSLYMLLLEDPAIEGKIGEVAVAAIRKGNEEAAWAALYVAVCWAGKKGARKYEELLSEAPELRSLPLTGEMETALDEFGYVGLF